MWLTRSGQPPTNDATNVLASLRRVALHDEIIQSSDTALALTVDEDARSSSWANAETATGSARCTRACFHRFSAANSQSTLTAVSIVTLLLNECASVLDSITTSATSFSTTMFCCRCADGSWDGATLLVSLSYEDTELALEKEPDVDERGLTLFGSFSVSGNIIEDSKTELRRLPVKMSLWLLVSRGSVLDAMLLADEKGLGDNGSTRLEDIRLTSVGLVDPKLSL